MKHTIRISVITTMVIILAAGFHYSLCGGEKGNDGPTARIAAGVSLPLDNFAGSNLDLLGYAGRGYNLQIEFFGRQGKVFTPVIGITASSQLVDTRSREKDLLNRSGAVFTVSADNYKTLWYLVGFNLQHPDIPIYVSARFGAQNVFVPDFKQVSAFGENTVSTDALMAFAFSGGGGFKMHDFDVSLRYFFARPVVEEHIVNYSVKRRYMSNVALVCATVGISF